LDLDAREYTRIALDESGVMAGVRPVALPPKPTPGGILTVTLDTVDTGERREMFGHTTRHIITRETRVASPGACSQSSEEERDGWYIDLDVRESCMKWKANYATAFVTSSTNHCSDETKVQRTGVEETGYPLQLKTTYRDRLPVSGQEANLTQVTELVEGPLDPGLFEVPEGFKRVWQLRGDASVPLGWWLRLEWENLKNDIGTLFR
jgi:hypothetical protein